MASSPTASHTEPVSHAAAPIHARVWRFSDCEFDELRRELRVRGATIEMEAKPLEVLRQLLIHSGEVVSKEALLDTVWPGTAVVDGSLATAISKLRKAIGGDDASIILTVPRVGYRMGVPVRVLIHQKREMEAAVLAAEDAVAAAPNKRGWSRPALALASLALLLISWWGVRRVLQARSGSGIHSIAVLPLANLSGDPAQEYLADGMTEELITELSKSQAVKVISRTSVMQYKDSRKPLPAIANELGVDAVVEGAVLRSGNRIRITAQLLDGRRDAPLWAENFDGEWADALNLQREIAWQISRRIDTATGSAQKRQLTAAGKVNPQAHELYLRGRSYWNQRTPETLYKAAEYFQEAIDADPAYPQSYAGLADAYIELVGFGNIEPDEGIAKATAAARHAIELDDSLAEAHSALGYIYAAEWQWADCEKEFRRALDLNPGYVVALYRYGFMLSMWGRQREAAALAQKALALDPLSSVVLYRAGRVEFHARHYERAQELFRRVLELRPGDQLGLYGAGLVYEAQGKLPEAIAAFGPPYQQSGFDIAVAYAAAGQREKARAAQQAEMRRLQQQNAYVRPGYIAELYTAFGDKDEAMRWLERGYREHDAWMTLLKVWPRFDPLRSDSRFQDLLRRMNFPVGDDGK